MKVQRDHLVRGQLPPVVQGQIPRHQHERVNRAVRRRDPRHLGPAGDVADQSLRLCGALAGLLRERLGRVPIHQEQFRAQRGAYVRARHLAIRPRRR